VWTKFTDVAWGKILTGLVSVPKQSHPSKNKISRKICRHAPGSITTYKKISYVKIVAYSTMWVNFTESTTEKYYVVRAL
jgi:hypothetical protein